MKLILLTCANSAVTDTATNNVSLFHVIEELQSPSFPMLLPSFTIVSILQRESGDRKKTLLHYRLKLGRKTLVELPLEIIFEGKKRHRTTGIVNGLTIPQPGILKAELRLKNRILGSWSIEVSHTGQTASFTPPAPVKKKITVKQAAVSPATPKTRKAGKKSTRKPKPTATATPKTRKAGKKRSRKP